MIDVEAATAFASERLAAAADPAKAGPMARYMKSDMPFYGVQKRERLPIVRDLIAGWPPADRAEYVALVEALWALPHREEKYLALSVARGHDRFVTLSSVPLYRRLIISGAWWDLADEVATKLSGTVLLRHRPRMTATVTAWLDHRSMWLRRSAIVAQVGHKDETDAGLLFHACASRAHETGFFIRKAIGWALRDYARTDPGAVARFVAESTSELSPLSRREATKHL